MSTIAVVFVHSRADATIHFTCFYSPKRLFYSCPADSSRWVESRTSARETDGHPLAVLDLLRCSPCGFTKHESKMSYKNKIPFANAISNIYHKI